MSHSTMVIPKVATYFGQDHPTPIIVAAFRPQDEVERLGLTDSAGRPARTGWIPASFDKHVSRSWLRKLREQGFTSVTLSVTGRRADFTIEELLGA